MNSLQSNWKQKAKHELTEMTAIAAYLSFFFCALVTYDLLLQRPYNVEVWNYGFAIVNALVITKVIMIGEYAKLGRGHENKSLFVSALWKAFVFGLLVFAFHFVEEVVKRLIHGKGMAGATRGIQIDQLASRTIVIFCVFVTLFAFREIRRVMGEEEFWSLMFRRNSAASPNVK